MLLDGMQYAKISEYVPVSGHDTFSQVTLLPQMSQALYGRFLFGSRG
jgi:hypothetical protein